MNPRRIKIILIFFTLAVVVILGTIALVCMDAAPPKDGDLRPARLDLPDEDNAFSLLAEAARRFTTPDGMEYDWVSMPYDSPDEKIPWRDDVASLMLDKNAGALELAEKALSCPLHSGTGGRDWTPSQDTICLLAPAAEGRPPMPPRQLPRELRQLPQCRAGCASR